MERKSLRWMVMKNTRKITIWLTAGGLGFLGVGIGVITLFPNTDTEPTPPTNLVAPTTPTALATIKMRTDKTNSTSAQLVSPEVPFVDYPPNSIGDACEVNQYPPYNWYYDLSDDTEVYLENDPFDSDGEWKLKNKCLTALDRHMSLINPYLWDKHNLPPWTANAFSFVRINNPLNFQRIFTDPIGDFMRVQEALARPECLLGKDADPNWSLHESCHANAIHNFALITRYCHKNGIYDRPTIDYWEEDNPTPAQDRGMWIQDLESAWVELKCESLDPLLTLSSDLHTDLREQILALHNEPEQPDAVRSQLREHFVSDHTSTIQDFFDKLPLQFNSSRILDAEEILIELAARLGDTAAGLTQPFSMTHEESGYKFGRLSGWFGDIDPYSLMVKSHPSVDRIYGSLSLFESYTGPDLRGFVENIDLEAIVQHFCTPPYYTTPWVGEDEIFKPPSCRSVVNTLRQKQEVQNNPSTLDRLATFEKIALRLEVYD